ncbi:MAG: TfoX/Sxy family DNA transformation protein [Chlamydiae bacterium]|nr:hypothetical protein [Chlamydiales bacterium]MCH9703860.1 TfoX/Sxy family DNA transformation protein [Chlamydiota bacterium]
MPKELAQLKNVGKATLQDLELLGIQSVEDLKQQDPTELFQKLETISNLQHDPCMWDIFAAIIHEAKTGEATNWWSWTPKRKQINIREPLVLIQKSSIGQFEFGVFANQNFEKDATVIQWNLKIIDDNEYEQLSQYEQENFCHLRHGKRFLYPSPERYVNRSNTPNVYPDFDKQANIALRPIKKGEELSIAVSTVEDF